MNDHLKAHRDFQQRMNDSMIELCETFQAWLQQRQEQVVNLDSYTPEPSQYQKIPIYYDDDEESSIPLRDIIISELPPIEDLVHTPSKSDGISKSECDLPVCDDSSPKKDEVLDDIISIPLGNGNDHFNAESILIESVLNRDNVISSPKIDFLLKEFAGELALIALIPLGIVEADFDPKGDIRFIENLMYDNSFPGPPETLKDDSKTVIDTKNVYSSSDNDSLYSDDIDYVEASPPDSDLVSLEVVEIVIPEVRRIDTDILLTIKDDILREKLLNVNLLIAISDFVLQETDIRQKEAPKTTTKHTPSPTRGDWECEEREKPNSSNVPADYVLLRKSQRVGKRCKWKYFVHPPVSLRSIVAVQREIKVRNLVASGFLPEDSFCPIFISMMMQGIYGWQVKNWSCYSVKAAVDHSFSAFIGTTCSGSKPTYSDQQRIVPSVSQTSGCSDNLMECVLHSFVAENEQDQDMIYEDFDQVDQLEMEEMDLKWQMAMLSLRINRFEKKAGRKMNYNNQQPARFDRRKVIDAKSKVYGMMAGLHADNSGADISNAADEFAMMGISPKTLLRRRIYLLLLKVCQGWGDACCSSPITGTYMPSPYKSDIEEIQVMTSFDSEDPCICDSMPPRQDKDFPLLLISRLAESDVEGPKNVCKNNFVRVKKCFVCGSKLHLIKDCDFYNCVDFVPCKSQAASVPAGSSNSSASITADGPDPAASRNRPAVVSAGRPNSDRGDPSTDNDIGIVDSGCSRSMTGNKEKLDDFVQIKGGIVKFGGGDGRISGKGTIRTSKLDFENVYYVEELQHFNLFSVSQICDKKNKVLFTDTDCLVLSEEFQLLIKEQKVIVSAKASWMKSQDGTEGWSCELSKQSQVAKEVSGWMGYLPVTILNTSDYLGKFEGKADDGYLVGYASNSKAYRVYNLPKQPEVEEPDLSFFEDKPLFRNWSMCGTQILTQIRVDEQGSWSTPPHAGIDSAVREPAGIVSADGVSTGSPSADSDPAGSNPADCFPPAGSVEAY
ncbi:ribonuclease H-like domain-containing protein [Tanacetum coccineum]